MDRPRKDQKRKQVDLLKFYQLIDNRKKKKQQEHQASCDRVLEEIFGDGPTIHPDDNIEPQEGQEVTNLKPSSKTKKQRRWKPSWKLEHPWAYPVVVDGKVRVKCEWCVFCNQRTPFAKKGSSTLQFPSLTEHSRSDEHKMAALKWENKDKRICVPLPENVATYEDKEKIRVITIMWQMYFVVRCAQPMELFEKLCLHQIEQGLPNMPKHTDYGTYLNRISGMEFVQAIKDVLWHAFCKDIQASPWYSLMIDDSTDQGKEGHMIVYVNYLRNGGKGDNHVVFVRLLKTDDGGAEAKHDALIKLLKEMGLCSQKLASLATDGCSVMIGCKSGLMARLKAEIPHLLSVHCLAHRENLAASQAISSFPELVYLDKLCRSIYAWLHASRKRMDDFRLVEGALNLPELAMLRIHSSKLVDIANISSYANATLRNLEKKFLRDSVGCGTKYLQHFVSQAKNGQITFFDAGGDIHVHQLEFQCIAGSNRTISFEGCMNLAKELVTKIVVNLRARMEEDIPVFDACKLFSPKHYPTEEFKMETCSKLWLEKILEQFGSLIADKEKCMGEMDSFTMVLASNFKHKSFREAWDVCKNDVTMRDSFPDMMRLWEILSVVPVNTAVVERGFFVQNTIKSTHRTSMSITTLENYMYIGLNGPSNTSDVPWDAVFNLWSKKKKKRSINTYA
ncbi:hypothetical protein L7F22_050710 [Adiantum nelumboides]|nr:hypothetical protein [Adiantum nelumboides]